MAKSPQEEATRGQHGGKVGPLMGWRAEETLEMLKKARLFISLRKGDKLNYLLNENMD